ncbi:tetratricopeptide repeat protein, partial [Acidobacteria bacterium AH-259-A15]|nr:tetratricopeptide repeat protein [Acidobacteria bacterium AH-259-A15]
KGAGPRNQGLGAFLRKSTIMILLILVSGDWSLAMFDGEYDAEIAKQREIIARDPTNLDAAYQLGNYLAWDGEYEEALAVFEEILKREPEYEDAEIGIARVYAWKGDQWSANQKYQEILAKNSKNFEAYQGLGLVALWANDFEKSIASFKKALAINSQDIVSLKGIGRAYLGRGDRRKAEEYFTRAQILEVKQTPLPVILAAAGGSIFLVLILSLWIRSRSRHRKKTILRLELKILRYALALYHHTTGTFPLTLESLLQETWHPSGETEEKPYLEGIRRDDRGFLIDPLGKRYWYNPDTGSVSTTTKGFEEW